MKAQRKQTPKEKSQIEVLTLRLEAMELRESMLKQRLDGIASNENAMNELRGATVELKGSFQTIYRSIENLRDDLKRGRTLRELPEPT